MFRFNYMKAAVAIGASMALSGCALMGAQTANDAESTEAARDARLVAGGAVEPVSFRTPPALRVSRPVGLAPCDAGAFGAADCWRKGDEHILFPGAAPQGEPSALTPPAPAEAE